LTLSEHQDNSHSASSGKPTEGALSSIQNLKAMAPLPLTLGWIAISKVFHVPTSQEIDSGSEEPSLMDRQKWNR